MGKINSKELLCNLIIQDNDNEVKKIIQNDPNLINAFINKNEDYTAICFSAYYGSIKTIKVLLEVIVLKSAW
jgi:hypothetical protein